MEEKKEKEKPLSQLGGALGPLPLIYTGSKFLREKLSERKTDVVSHGFMGF